MSSELQKRTAVGVALIAMALGALLAGGAIFWILMSVAGVLMQREWGALVDPREMWVRVAMFAVSVPLAILSPWAAGLDGFAAGIAVRSEEHTSELQSH